MLHLALADLEHESNRRETLVNEMFSIAFLHFGRNNLSGAQYATSSRFD